MHSDVLILVTIILGCLILPRVYLKIAPSKVSRSNIGEDIRTRTNSWAIMVAFIFGALLLGQTATILLFLLISILALREYISIIETTVSDHRALLYLFFVLPILHYGLLWFGEYGLFAIVLPVYGFLLLSIRSALRGGPEGYLRRIATMQFGMMACVYCVSHAPALLKLSFSAEGYSTVAFFLYFLLIIEISDVFQYVFGKKWGCRKIVPLISPNKTIEGFLGGVLTASLLGAALSFATPFSPLSAFFICLLSCFMGFLGDCCFSAIKRDAGTKDFGELLPGHGGILDRIDSLCFAVPIFFHLTRYYYGAAPTPFF